jgi:hypothetical protein
VSCGGAGTSTGIPVGRSVATLTPPLPAPVDARRVEQPQRARSGQRRTVGPESDPDRLHQPAARVVGRPHRRLDPPDAHGRCDGGDGVDEDAADAAAVVRVDDLEGDLGGLRRGPHEPGDPGRVTVHGRQPGDVVVAVHGGERRHHRRGEPHDAGEVAVQARGRRQPGEDRLEGCHLAGPQGAEVCGAAADRRGDLAVGVVHRSLRSLR